MDLKEVLEYELGSLPFSLANFDGTLKKCAKSNLFNHLEVSMPVCEDEPFRTPKIYDGMVLLQKLPPMLQTFGDVSDYLVRKILQGSARIAFFVTDYYLDNSVKSMERDRRSATGSLRMSVMRQEQKMPKAVWEVST